MQAQQVIRGAYWLDEPGRRVIMRDNSRNMDSRTCAQCGTPVSSEDLQCPGCGAALPATDSASPPPESSNLGKKALRIIGIVSLVVLVGVAVAVWLRSRGPSAPPPAVVKVVDVEAVKAKAEAGDAEAQKTLGECYSNGQGVKQDYAQAAQWYRKAADQGNAAAQAALGELYEVGQGVQRDDGRSRQMVSPGRRTGIRSGTVQSCGALPDGDTECGRTLPRLSNGIARQPSRVTPSRNTISACVTRKAKVSRQDPVEAYKWLSLAATRGIPDATQAREALQQGMTREQIKEGQSRAASFAPKKPAPPAQ